MRIYTRTGDAGETGLIGGGRVAKDAARVEAYGTVDELSAHLGLARTLVPDDDLRGILARVQNDLFDVGASLATPSAPGTGPGGAATSSATPEQVAEMERDIDALQAQVPPLRRFILPGGSHAGAVLHVARTVCRRAERRMVTLGHTEPIDAEALTYINRLSDLLFVMARTANARAGTPEPEWQRRG